MFDRVLNIPLRNIDHLKLLKKYNEGLSVLEINMEIIGNCHHIETSQLICMSRQLTGLYAIAFARKTMYSIQILRSSSKIF